MEVKKGRFYTLIRQNPETAPAKEYSKKYRSLTKQKAEYFLVMRCIDFRNSLCVPVVKESHSHQVDVKLNDNDYFADYLTFLTIPNVLLEETNIYYHNSYALVDRIYKKSSAHYKQAAKRLHKKKIRERKRQKEIRRDNQYLRECSYEQRSLIFSDRPPSSVTWRMSHPAQGGRTSPR